MPKKKLLWCSSMMGDVVGRWTTCILGNVLGNILGNILGNVLDNRHHCQSHQQLTLYSKLP
jgi:membrane protein YqaA with SNARE-associated domain